MIDEVEGPSKDWPIVGDRRVTDGAEGLPRFMQRSGHEDSGPQGVQTGVQQETGALREAIGTKIDTALVPYELTCAAAVGLNYGAEKYAPRNFEKGLSERNLLMSIERHTRALMDGAELDEDSCVPHACLLASSVAMYVACVSRGSAVRDLPEPSLRKYGVDEVAKRFMTVQQSGTTGRSQKGGA